MHKCVETALSCYYFYVCALGQQYWSTKSTCIFSRWKCPDIKSFVTLAGKMKSSSAQPLWYWSCKTRRTLLEVLLLHLRENFHLHCLPHLCWLTPWGHQCCFSAGYRQKASFHLARTWGRWRNTWHVSIFILAVQYRNICFSESSLGIKVSRQAICSYHTEATLAAPHRHSLHTEWRWVWEEQQEWRVGNKSLLCSKTWQPF